MSHSLSLFCLPNTCNFQYIYVNIFTIFPHSFKPLDMAVQDNQRAGEKVLKVLCNAYSGEKIAVVASNYHEFIEKCKLKFF